MRKLEDFEENIKETTSPELWSVKSWPYGHDLVLWVKKSDWYAINELETVGYSQMFKTGSSGEQKTLMDDICSFLQYTYFHYADLGLLYGAAECEDGKRWT